MEIISVNEENKKQVLDFLKDIQLVQDVNEAVVLNGEFLLDNEIVGLLSFEEFNRIALIRYFIFKKAVSEQVILDLFKKIIVKASRKQVEALITLVVKKEAIDIFKGLGFYEIDRDDVYIEETNILDTKFRDAYVLKYDIASPQQGEGG